MVATLHCAQGQHGLLRDHGPKEVCAQRRACYVPLATILWTVYHLEATAVVTKSLR